MCAWVYVRAWARALLNLLKYAFFLVFNGFKISDWFLGSVITNPSLEFRNSKCRIEYGGINEKLLDLDDI